MNLKEICRGLRTKGLLNWEKCRTRPIKSAIRILVAEIRKGVHHRFELVSDGGDPVRLYSGTICSRVELLAKLVSHCNGIVVAGLKQLTDGITAGHLGDFAAAIRVHPDFSFVNGSEKIVLVGQALLIGPDEEKSQKIGFATRLMEIEDVFDVAPVDEFPVDKWDTIIAINMSSAFHTTAAALPMMRKAGWGRVVNIASAHGLTASPYKSAYVAAKHGLVGLTKVVALELAEHGFALLFFLFLAQMKKTDLFEDIIIDNSQALQMANMYTNILNGIHIRHL